VGTSRHCKVGRPAGRLCALLVLGALVLAACTGNPKAHSVPPPAQRTSGTLSSSARPTAAFVKGFAVEVDGSSTTAGPVT
jgi:hypothetical protein